MTDLLPRKVSLTLMAYVAFVVVAVLLGLAMLFYPSFQESSNPILGTPMTGLFYVITLFFAIAPLFAAGVNVAGCFRAIGGFAFFIAAYGALIAIGAWTGSDIDESFRIAPPQQMIWTICVPLAWGILFFRLGRAAKIKRKSSKRRR